MAITPTKHAKTPPKNFFFKNKGNQEKKVEDFFLFKKAALFLFLKRQHKISYFLYEFHHLPKIWVFFSMMHLFFFA